MFNIFLTIHIITGIICLLTGLLAGFSKKRRGKHTTIGKIYHGSFVFVFISTVVMSIMHWDESAYLFLLVCFHIHLLSLVIYLQK